MTLSDSGVLMVHRQRFRIVNGCRAEACIVIFLRVQTESDASTASVLLAGSFVNQDGRSSSLTAPNGPAQQLVIRGALHAANLPAQVSYWDFYAILDSYSYAVIHGQHVKI